jgi:hypothetical protein
LDTKALPESAALGGTVEKSVLITMSDEPLEMAVVGLAVRANNVGELVE